MPLAGQAIEIWLVRHGQSTWNAERRWQGQADPPLSDVGRLQAAEAARGLPRLDLVASSPQQRALETATIMVEEYAGPNRLPQIQLVDGLRERNAGPWSGLTRDEIEDHYPGFLDDGRRPEGYEGDAPLLQRALQSLELVAEVAVNMAGTRGSAVVLVMCHGGVINTVQNMLGTARGRVPNLAGRVVQRAVDGWNPGQEITLLGPEMVTGGDSNRV